MSTAQVQDSDQNPYHPYDEIDRYRAFRDGWVARREGRSCAANPYPFAQVSEALAWLDGWTAAAEEEPDADSRPIRVYA